jgi:hypothetical protein
MSKRFSMKRFLGMTQEEIAENESLWREENSSTLKPPTNPSGEMRSAGITPGGMTADTAAAEAEAPPDMAAAAEGGAEAAPAEPAA